MKRASIKSLIALSLVVLTAGIGLKMMRYATPPQRMNETFDERLTKFLKGTGWQRQAQNPDAKNNAVQIISFSKPGCTKPLRVSIVGTTSGLESYLRQTFGDDLAFVQHGSVRQHPSLVWYQVVGAWRRASTLLSGDPRVVTDPILAIIPAPKAQSKPCGGPRASTWAQL